MTSDNDDSNNNLTSSLSSSRNSSACGAPSPNINPPEAAALVEQIQDNEVPADNLSASLAAYLEATNKGTKRRHVEILNDGSVPYNPLFDSSQFDDIETGRQIKAEMLLWKIVGENMTILCRLENQ